MSLTDLTSEKLRLSLRLHCWLKLRTLELLCMDITIADGILRAQTFWLSSTKDKVRRRMWLIHGEVAIGECSCVSKKVEIFPYLSTVVKRRKPNGHKMLKERKCLKSFWRWKSCCINQSSCSVIIHLSDETGMHTWLELQFRPLALRPKEGHSKTHLSLMYSPSLWIWFSRVKLK